MNLIDEVLRLDKEATNPARFKVDRYDHGGGRVSVNDIGGRELIADLYEPASERDCWIMCRTAAPKLARALKVAMEALEQAIKNCETNGWDHEVPVDALGEIERELRRP